MQHIDGEIETNYNKSVERFDDLNLKQELLRGIYGYGYEHPSAIQKKAILPIIEKRDVIAQAQSGTGKTATFCIGILQNIDVSLNHCQAIVMSPTRELALQSNNVMKSIGDFMGVKSLGCVGGRNVQEDLEQIKAGVHCAVGTPGRILDLLKRGALSSQYIKMFVLDEADEMLSRGFEDSVRECIQELDISVQCVILSATLSDEVTQLAKNFMRDPVKILVKKEELTLDGIRQYYINCSEDQYKYGVLEDLFQKLTLNHTVIFCNTKQKVCELADKMQANNGTVVSAIYAGMTQEDRELIMKQFKNGASRILISTDLTARGIDVQSVSLVINYDLPKQYQNYIHRIGRSGRFGRKGTALNFVTERDMNLLDGIRAHYQTEIPEMPEDTDTFLA